MKSWKKRWIKELQEKTPTLAEDVKNAPIPTLTMQEQGTSTKKTGVARWIAAHKQRFFGALATCMAAVVAMIVAIPLAVQSITPTPPTSSSSQIPPIVSVSKTAAISVEINPAAVFSVDEEGKVSTVVAMNADADIIISSDDRLEQMKGKLPEEAVAVFVDYAAQLGYLDLGQTSAVRISACGNEESLNKVSEKITQYFCQKGVYSVVIGDLLTCEGFCERIGLPQEVDVDALLSSVGDLNMLFTERTADGKTADERKELYKGLLASEIEEVLQETLQQNLDTVREKVFEELSKINPAFNTFPSHIIDSFIEGFFAENTTEQLLQMIDIQLDDIAIWLKIPETMEEYTAALDAYFKDAFAEKAEEHRAVYEESRSSLSVDAYQQFLDELQESHGSLNAFWDTLQQEK